MLNRQNKNINKFTIIELLIVIAIISILASMLLPTLSTARNKGKAIKCASNLKQCNFALLLYAEDYAGWGCTSVNTTNYLLSAPELLGHYLAKKPNKYELPAAAICPMGRRFKDSTTDCVSGLANFSYGGNFAYIYGCHGTTGEVLYGDAGTGYRISNIRGPSKRFLMGEIGHDGIYYSTNSTTAAPVRIDRRDRFSKRHPNISTNVAFADGHVTAMTHFQIPVNGDNEVNDPEHFYREY